MIRKHSRGLIFVSLFALGCAAQAAEPALNKIPGSADTPPTAVKYPLPPPPPQGADQRAGVKLGVWIRADGTVESAEVLSGTPEWREAALAAVRQWKFEPVQWQGQPILARTVVSLYCMGPKIVGKSLSALPNLPGEIHDEEEWGLTKPETIVDPDIILPLAVRGDHQRWEATLRYVVNEEGRTGQIEPQGGSSEGALRSALDLVAEHTYKPARIRDRPVAVQYEQRFVFSTMEPRIEALSGADDIVDPVYPYDRLLAQEEGHATVRFTLDEKGGIASTELVEASHPAFGGALIAAVESWQFTAEAAADKKVREYRHEFRLDDVAYAARRLMTDVRAGKRVSGSGAGLDARPEVLGSPALGYPRALIAKSVAGSAQVELIIDRTGLAQLPRVVQTSDPAFGWAAVTCVNGMRFKPLTRGGKPTELKVVLPFDFTPPSPADPEPAKPAGS